jgi:hypothetical protein
MKHIFGIRNRGDAALLLRGHNGRAIRQHLTGIHNHMRRGGALSLNSIVHGITHSAPKAISNVIQKGSGKSARTYIPLKFRL